MNFHQILFINAFFGMGLSCHKDNAGDTEKYVQDMNAKI